MREIKFRMWAHASRVYFKPDTNENGVHMVNGYIYDLPNTTLEQYTGLKDSKGVEIYEGDIIEFDADEWGDTTSNKFIVEWEEKDAGWSLGGGGMWCDMEWRTVIGNIHSNPELLDEQ